MTVQAMGYFWVGTSKLDDWTSFAIGQLGLQAVDRGGAMRAFRMDDRKQRLIADGGAVGRRLDFLAQEFNREANTLTSKASDNEIAALMRKVAFGGFLHGKLAMGSGRSFAGLALHKALAACNICAPFHSVITRCASLTALSLTPMRIQKKSLWRSALKTLTAMVW